MSRVEDGEIIEDCAASDNVELIRQLGSGARCCSASPGFDARLMGRTGASYTSCACSVSAGARRAGMSTMNHRPDAAVSAATSAIAPL
jgi:hypothetical protein